MSGQPTRTVHFGLGPIGLAVLRSAISRGVAVVGAVDVRPELIGADVGELAGVGHCGVDVTASLVEVGPPGRADAVVHCAGSQLARVENDIIAALQWDASVVTTCEELAYPWYHHRAAAERIQAAARAAGRTVLATGINPGFAMDTLAILLSAVTERVDAVRIRRIVDAGSRRGPLQLKVGAGISRDEFERRRSAGAIGHVGLVESVAIIGDALGWQLDAIDETLEPVIATTELHTDVVAVAAGSVAGIAQVATGRQGGRERIRLDLQMYVGAPDPHDETILDGQPLLHARTTGLHGDVCTAAVTANAVAGLDRMPTGLLTVLDLLPLRNSMPADGGARDIRR